MVRGRFWTSSFLTLFLLALTAWFTHAWWLPWFGHALVRDDGPAKAEIAVVLGGDEGRRIAKAAELVSVGYVPAVLVSGPRYYDIHECDVAIDFAVRRGYPTGWFIPFPNETHSTREEAGAILAELGRRGIHSFLLVTSDYHTARAGRLFRAAIAKRGGPEMRVVAAPDEYFREDSWWRDREAQKVVFFEWAKTVATALGH